MTIVSIVSASPLIPIAAYAAIDRTADVGGRIDQRAVEIEDRVAQKIGSLHG